jgi:uncharacterized protein (DUF58 family)
MTLFPDIDELLALRHQARGMGLVSSIKTSTPLSGLYASVFRGQGMDFDEVREYRAGDEVRHIDWRVTARMRKPYLKVFREERERDVVLCVDCSRKMAFATQGTFKSIQAARIAALLGWSAQAHGDRVGGVLFGRESLSFFAPSRALRTFSQFLRGLAQPPSETNNTPVTDLAHVLPVLSRSTDTGSLLFIISDFNWISVTTLQRHLSLVHQQHEVVLIALDDIMDYELPEVGWVNFVEEDGRSVRVNLDDAAARVRYRQAWHVRRDALIQTCRRLAIDFFSVHTDQDPYQAVITGLRQRAARSRAHR